MSLGVLDLFDTPLYFFLQSLLNPKNKECHRPLLSLNKSMCWLGFLYFLKWGLMLVWIFRIGDATFCHCLGCVKSNFLWVTKNRYLDYGIIRNATCHLTWAFIGVFESFLMRELKKTPYINVMAQHQIHLQVSFCILIV